MLPNNFLSYISNVVVLFPLVLLLYFAIKKREKN